MATGIARFRNMTLTQGSSDAFVQASEVTGIDPGAGRGWLCKRLELEFPIASGLQGMSADSAVSFAMTRDSKAAVSGLDDSDTMAVISFSNALTTSGEVIVPNTWKYEFPEGVIVVEPTIYCHLDSTATGLTMTGNVRLYYEEVKLSEVEILRMLTQG